MEQLLIQLIGSEDERKAQVEALEKAMLPMTTSIRTFVKGKLVMELSPQ
jgi:hypothetical protein